MPTIHCDGCGLEFQSRNSVFRHLKETNGACLPPESFADFQKYVLAKDRKKVVILYGYTIVPNNNDKIKNGQEAAIHLLQTLEEQMVAQITEATNDDDNNNDDDKKNSVVQTLDLSKINRSYGTNGRSEDILQQDEGTGAVAEVLATRLPSNILAQPLDSWLQDINYRLQQEKGLTIRVFGRLEMPQTKFNAEMDVSHRRVEYLLPADFLLPGQKLSQSEFFRSLPSFVDGHFFGIHRNRAEKDGVDNKELKATRLEAMNRQKSRPDEATLTYLLALKKKMQSMATHVVELNEKDEAAVIEKRFHKQKRKKQRYKTDNRNQQQQQEQQQQQQKNKKNKVSNQQDLELENRSNNDTHRNDKDGPEKQTRNENNGSNENNDNVEQNAKENKKRTNVLQRKRFHNFAPKVLAHDFFAYRRLDRMYHRATLRIPDDIYDEVEKSLSFGSNQQEQQQKQAIKLDRSRPFMALSLNGDMFLNGQTCRVIGLFIALARGIIDDDFIDCVFDEEYPHLVPTPAAPTFGMYAGEAFYVSWEGKCQMILTPRPSNRYPEGWNDNDTRQRVQEYQAQMREEVAKAWLSAGVDSEGRLLAEKKWTEEVLEPWVVNARKQLEDYRQWKKTRQATKTNQNSEDAQEAPSVILPPLDSIDNTVPFLYEMVLKCLRKADQSGIWPSTTPKRQMVMVSTPTTGSDDDASKNAVFSSLAIAHMRAKKNKTERSSAYKFQEGQGGASGSFSVGAMPGDRGCHQPKSNTLFPELMKAAFELERALFPDREPSSTIAINRNAQFRPHTDSGAGAGQSTSLIVALGDFVGGELVVEGEKKDIRYNAIEFNGWTQPHWTMPFRGERYSLVWFTPKGCEGVHGIDLCK